MSEILSIGELLDLGTAANMSAYIPYSGLNYNASGAISGISGSAIAGGIESSVVSSIVSSMVSGKADQSAVDSCCSAMSAEVSAKLDATASSLFQQSGEYAYESSLSSYLPSSASSNFAPSADYALASSLSSYIPYSAVDGDSNQITSINGSAIAGGGGDTAGLVPFSSFGYQDTAISSISSSAVYDPSAHARIDELSSNAVSYTSFEYNTSNNITAVNGSAIGVNLNETPLVIDGNTMSAAASSDGIHIGMIGAQVKIVSNSSQATAANIVYVVTG